MAKRKLPTFIEPMLAKPSQPFDSGEYLYEIKWDGFRALCFAESGDYRLIGRRKTDFTDLFPELAPLKSLPAGCVLDGEIVVMVKGKPDFRALLKRQREGRAFDFKYPATYVPFDLLYESYKPLMALTCEQRRSRLASLLETVSSPRIVMSRSIVKDGVAYFEQAVAAGLEGVVAKKRISTYQPGLRSDSWLKIKARNELICAIIGYEPSAERQLKSLIVAAPVDGELRFIGQVGSGLSAEMHARLVKLLQQRECKTPVVPCKIKGKWVVPDLFCRVSYLEMTSTGKLRGPVFEGLYGE